MSKRWTEFWKITTAAFLLLNVGLYTERYLINPIKKSNVEAVTARDLIVKYNYDKVVAKKGDSNQQYWCIHRLLSSNRFTCECSLHTIDPVINTFNQQSSIYAISGTLPLTELHPFCNVRASFEEIDDRINFEMEIISNSAPTVPDLFEPMGGEENDTDDKLTTVK